MIRIAIPLSLLIPAYIWWYTSDGVFLPLVAAVLTAAGALVNVASATLRRDRDGFYSVKGGAPFSWVVRDSVCSGYWKATGALGALVLLSVFFSAYIAEQGLWSFLLVLLFVALAVSGFIGFIALLSMGVVRLSESETAGRVIERVCPHIGRR